MFGKSPHMKFVDNQIAHLIEGVRRVSPVEIVFYYPRMIESVLPLTLSPATLTCHGSGVRVQKHMLPVEQQPFFRVPGAVQPVGVLKFLDIKAKHNHGIHLTDFIMIREP